MDENGFRQCWEENAEAWTALSRAGYDICRDFFNTPGFFAMLPDVNGLRGLDVGCGEGHNTRLVAKRGAVMTGVDVAAAFIRYARAAETAEPLGIQYQVANGADLPFAAETFGFAVAFMSLMDMASPRRALTEAYRVLKPGGFFQFSICHPCSDTPYRRWLEDEDGRKYALAVGGYFDLGPAKVSEWIFYSAPEELKARYPKFRIPWIHQPLSDWLNATVAAGFRLERFGEPSPDEDALARRPELYDARIVPFYFHILCRK